MPPQNSFVETPDKIYGCEFFEKKDVPRIYYIENAEIKYHWRFIFQKLLIKGTAVNLFGTKKSCVFISLKMLNKVPLRIYFVETPEKRYGCEFI